MPSKCCAVGCSKRDDRDDDVRFFRFPALLKKPDELVELSEQRRNAWLEAINRPDIPEIALKYTRICSEHFVTGFPSRLKDTNHPDWVPTIKMGPKGFKRRRPSDKKRSPSPDNQFYSEPPKKTRGYTPRLSEVERLRLEIKSKDELIKNYRNEKVQREQDQIQVVSSYEKRLKEKDVKIKKGMRERGNKEDTISIEQEEETEGRGTTMRVGRKLRKTIVEEKKTKPCFVRLEKVHEKKQEAPVQKEQRTPANRKLTGPLKKRPLNTPSQVFNKKEQESPFTVASTRTRRAPKPNPKYANADIITPKAKAKRGKELLASFDADSDSDDYYNALDESSNESETNDGNVGEAFEVDESSDFSELEELHLKPKRALRSVAPVVAVNVNTPPVAKRGRPKKHLTTASPAVKAVELPSKKAVPAPAVPRTGSTPSQQLQLARKRKLEAAAAAAEVEPPESIIARNKRLNIALYDANVAKPLTSPKSASPKITNTPSNSRTASPTASSVLAQRRAERAAQLVKSVNKDTREKSKSPLYRQKSPAGAARPKSPDTLDPASTQDDFETMPTFTIVNIHDIINKKGDSLVQKTTEDEKGNTSPNTTNRVNRRKTGHTTILSEKLDPGKLRNPLPRTPFPPRKPISTILNSNNITSRAEAKQPARVAPPERKPLPPVIAEKPAPRILNSVVAKRTYPVQPILGKLDNDIEMDPTDDPIEKTQMVKENVGANKVIPLKPALPRKLPPEKVFVQRQGNKLIKKITCFETWYVINIPETQEPIVKNCLDIPLITLSNAAKTIKLPSPSWSTKVTLYKLSAQMIGKTNLTPYTGDLSDQSIAEEDREKYQPSCVMFRRMTQQKSRTRMPYDRAVIFKMKTFFTNIDGKNVRLIGAPSTISTFEDIEVLLELIDELDLLHEFVEPANTI